MAIVRSSEPGTTLNYILLEGFHLTCQAAGTHRQFGGRQSVKRCQYFASLSQERLVPTLSAAAGLEALQVWWYSVVITLPCVIASPSPLRRSPLPVRGMGVCAYHRIGLKTLHLVFIGRSSRIVGVLPSVLQNIQSHRRVFSHDLSHTLYPSLDAGQMQGKLTTGRHGACIVRVSSALCHHPQPGLAPVR